MLHTAVLVDNKDLIRFLPIREGATGRVNLTTIVPDQPNASIEVYIVGARGRTLVHTFSATGLTQVQHPEIILSAFMREDLILTLRVNGEMVARAHVAVPRPRERSRLFLTLAIALICITAIVGIYFLVDLLRDGRGGQTNTRANGPPAAAAESSESTSAVPPKDSEPAVSSDDSSAELEETVWRTEKRWVAYFAAESAFLLPEAAATLDEIVSSYQGLVDGDSKGLLRITGHAALYDDEQSRQQLSVQRADAVASYLSASGVDIAFEAAGVGGTSPVTTAEHEQWLNRRVEIDFSTQE